MNLTHMSKKSHTKDVCIHYIKVYLYYVTKEGKINRKMCNKHNKEIPKL
jgi:hypothetical protein